MIADLVAAATADVPIDRVQEMLRAAGFDPGAQDGVCGPRTARAIRAFQRSRGLRVTGEVDEACASLLRRATSGTAQAAASAAAASPIPWPDVSRAQWARFIRAMVVAPPTSVGVRGHLGMFYYDPRRLETLGIVERTHMVASVRTCAWRAPMTSEEWCRPLVQLRIFARDLVSLREAVDAKHASTIGQVHAGRVATRSGLLAVAHVAGLRGLAAWLTNVADKARYPNTTAAFLRATGFF